MGNICCSTDTRAQKEKIEIIEINESTDNQEENDEAMKKEMELA